jgi:hypothetical protein
MNLVHAALRRLDSELPLFPDWCIEYRGTPSTMVLVLLQAAGQPARGRTLLSRVAGRSVSSRSDRASELRPGSRQTQGSATPVVRVE